MRQGFQDIALRLVNGDNQFLDNLREQFGTTTAQGEKVLRVFRKCKAVKRELSSGRWMLTHGAFWESKVIQRAIDSPE